MDELLPEALVARYLEIRVRDVVESKEFYFKELMPLVRRYLESVEEYQTGYAGRFETLVSLMGYSPETTAVAATILRPKRLIIAYSDGEEAKRAARPALNYLVSAGIVDQFGIDLVAVDAFSPDDIYGKLRTRIPSGESLVFDITGGTKVMSATAGSLAWELDLTLCYLDGTWDPRSGSSGLKNATKLKLIQSPRRQKGHEVRRAGLEFYNQGHYVAAEAAFAESRKLISDSFFDQLAFQLCGVYQALADLDGPRLERGARALREMLEIGGFRAVAAALDVVLHVEALERVAAGEPMTRLAAFLELAERYRTQGRYDFSCLFSYRALEASVELGLSRLFPTFSMDEPNYELLGDVAEIARVFRFEPGLGPALPRKLRFLDAFQLLCIVDKLHERFPEPTTMGEAIKGMMKYAQIRNQSNLAHGTRTLNQHSTRKLEEGLEQLLTAVLGAERESLEAERRALKPRALEAVAKRSG